jgi:hypothetical protein
MRLARRLRFRYKLEAGMSEDQSYRGPVDRNLSIIFKVDHQDRLFQEGIA